MLRGDSTDEKLLEGEGIDETDLFVALTNDYVLGHPLEAATTLGPMVRPAAAAFVRDQIAEAVGKGARKGLGEPPPQLAKRER